MAKLGQVHAATPDVKLLVDKVEAAQRPEIDTMTGWLEAWGKKVPSESDDDLGGMDHGMGDTGSDEMPGMMTDRER